MIDALKQIDLFKHLDEGVLSRLAERTVCKKYFKGGILFFEGEVPRALTILHAGELSLYKSDQRGNKTFLYHFFPGAVIAEIALFDRSPYPATAIFESDGEVLLLELDNITDLITKEPMSALAMIKSLTQKILYLEDIIHNNVVLDSTGRAAKYLIEHENDTLQMKKNLIAHKLNMTPATFSRILTRFKALKFIEEQRQRILIINREGLQQLYTV